MDQMISIVVPVYNVEKYVAQCVESLMRQTYGNIEIILIDDGSTDNTREVVNAVQDRRIRYVKLEGNHGAGYARNRGAEISTGKEANHKIYDCIQDA